MMRRKSKNPTRKLIDKADRALQDWYRAKYPNEKCESCGNRFELMHHFYEKSQSAYLRYDKRNLIFLCNSCHFRHHQTGDQNIMARVIAKRGMRWLNKLMKLKQVQGKIDKQIAEQMIKKYA